MNGIQEAMARRSFGSGSVDFDPVHAKAARYHKHHEFNNPDLNRRALPKMSVEIAELFPDGFEDITLGFIPMGSKAGTVPDAIELNPLCSIANGMLVPWLEVANMPAVTSRFGLGTTGIQIGNEVYQRRHSRHRITRRMEKDKTEFVDFLEDDEVGTGSTEDIVLRPKPPFPPVFAYVLARTEEFRQYLITNMTGTSGRQRAPTDCLNSFPVAVPPKQISDSFSRTTEQLFCQMKVSDQESAMLMAARDKILPRLLSGGLICD